MKKTLLVVWMLLMALTPALAAEKLTLMLDWFPNVDHVPIYVARDAGIFAAAGLDVQILTPSETTDGLKLAAAGKADIAVSYEPQAIVAASTGLPVRVVGRLVEHPLTVLLFLEKSGIKTPADLEGRKLGYTVPGMMDILLEAFAAKNDIRSYTPINVGYSIVPSLVAGKVAAIMGPYKNYEAVELELKGYTARYFEPAEFGIPDYDELVFISGRKTLVKRAKVIQAFNQAIAQAIVRTRQDPAKALELYFKAVPEADKTMETKAFAVTLPLFATTQAHDSARWQRFADFALQAGLITSPVNAADLLQDWDDR